MKKARYRRITIFFAKVILSLAFWELILSRIGLRGLANKNRDRRLLKIAHNFRLLAVDMGGVMIKVGQFFSSRMDVLPEVITAELAGLQDEVAAESYEDIARLAESEYNAPLDKVFAEFDKEPLAAASLGQVHRAKLFPPKEGETGEPFGTDVVVKVQRPNIEEIITIDLAALRTVGDWVMRYKPIRKRIDVPAILVEFSRITFEEIDYQAEGRNAETFGEDFKDIPGVRIPAVVWNRTTKRVLTLENVLSIKITDYDQIEEAGIDRKEVATRVFDAYMKQIFDQGFFHADPHPGNLFVDPNGGENSDWQLTFVDFGMVGHIPPNALAGLREFAIGLGTKDSKRMIKAYQLLGMILPGADLDLIQKADSMVFDRFWGKNMDELKEISFQEVHEFTLEFRELVYDMPFQAPQDIIFLIRTISILSGICIGLDPEFNFWEVLAPYAKKLISEEVGGNWQGWVSEAGSLLQSVIALPRKAENVLTKIERGEISIRTPMVDWQLRGVNRGIRRVGTSIFFLAFLTNGIILYINQYQTFAWILFGGAAFSLVSSVFSRRTRKTP